jgi:hypothetical protein
MFQSVLFLFIWAVLSWLRLILDLITSIQLGACKWNSVGTWVVRICSDMTVKCWLINCMTWSLRITFNCRFLKYILLRVDWLRNNYRCLSTWVMHYNTWINVGAANNITTLPHMLLNVVKALRSSLLLKVIYTLSLIK